MAIDLSAALGAVEGAFGVAAVYAPPSPPGGDSIAVTLVASAADADLSVGGSRSRAAAGKFQVRASVLASPVKGGTLTMDVGGAEWKITDAPAREDPDRLVWTLRCELVSGG